MRLGMYEDSDSSGPTGGTPASDPYYPGPSYFRDEHGKKGPVDTFFMIHAPGDFSYEMIREPDISTDNAIVRARALYNAHKNFAAVSGTALIPQNYSSIDNPVDGADAGQKYTTRIGIGYLPKYDELIIFEGGSYNNGPARLQLAGIFAATGIGQDGDPGFAMELDGGGSAAVGVQQDKFTKVGGALAASGCPGAPVWCTKPGQPDGKPRPVPTWLGFDLTVVP